MDIGHAIALWIHLVAMIVWIGALFALAALSRSGARDAVLPLIKRAGIAADAGATLMILTGIKMILDAPIWMRQPWLHAKLTLVVVVLALHGFLRAKAKRGGAIPAAIAPILALAVVLIVGCAVLKF